MAKLPALESTEIRDKINEAMKAHPEGLSPSKTFEALYGRSINRELLDDTNAMQRIYYWLKQMAKSKHLSQHGRANSSVYRLNNGRPKPDVADIPKEKPHRAPRGSKNAALNGNTELVAFLVDDIRGKLDKLVELVTH